MTQQLDIFSQPRIEHVRARSTDPLSSHEAADRLERSGRAVRQASEALAAVGRWPGQTSRDLARLSGIDRYILARRLPELAEKGIIKRVETRDGLRWWVE